MTYVIPCSMIYTCHTIYKKISAIDFWFEINLWGGRNFVYIYMNKGRHPYGWAFGMLQRFLKSQRDPGLWDITCGITCSITCIWNNIWLDKCMK